MGYLAAITSRVAEARASHGILAGTYVPGLRLEMHPRVRYEVYRDPDTHPGVRAVRPEGLFGVPVKVTPELPDGTWRLVIVRETVLASGGGEPLAIVPRAD